MNIALESLSTSRLDQVYRGRRLALVRLYSNLNGPPAARATGVNWDVKSAGYPPISSHLAPPPRPLIRFVVSTL